MAFWNRKDKGAGSDKPAEPGEQTEASAPVDPADMMLPAAAAQSVFALAPDIPEMPVEEKRSWLSRLSGGLAKSSSRVTQGLGDLVSKRRLDQEMLEQLEENLVAADLGPATAARIVAEFSRDRFGKDVDEDEVRAALAQSITEILAPVAKPLDVSRVGAGPRVILVCGVNGVGKTTTIGKIAYDLSARMGKRVMLAAGDTFRAAAREQLGIWAQRANAGLFAKGDGADSASVAYEAYEKAVAEQADILLIDTAGRLHNKAHLMAELEKIVRVLKKRDPAVPHAVLLVLDATTGQNAHEQVRVFQEIVAVTGLVVTKLDGSAKGGVVVGLADRFGLPIHLVGVGEGAEDLQAFRAEDFARGLVGL